jgi:hypothetical protein
MKKAPETGASSEPLHALFQGSAKATSSFSEQLFSSGRLSWLRSSSIDSP